MLMKTEILNGDCIEMMKTLPDKSVNCCVTSPPYFGLRDYGHEGQIGLEETPEAFVQKMVEVFREVKRVLRDDGTLWLNLGDSYAGSGKGRNADGSHQEGGKQGTNKGTVLGSLVKTYAPDCKPKDLIGIPWRVAFALQADGWYLRQDIIWHKPNPMPESVTDRCTKAHEYIFLLSKSSKYYYDIEPIREPIKPTSGVINGVSLMGEHRLKEGGRKTEKREYEEIKGANKRSVWSVNTKSYKEAHFATYPPELIRPCILAGCPKGGVVLDPFGGSGTTAAVATEEGRNAILCELNPEYIPLINQRLSKVQPSLF
jgi:site-specific DNA-methyltransferase (adenine-specific)